MTRYGTPMRGKLSEVLRPGYWKWRKGQKPIINAELDSRSRKRLGLFESISSAKRRLEVGRPLSNYELGLFGKTPINNIPNLSKAQRKKFMVELKRRRAAIKAERRKESKKESISR